MATPSTDEGTIPELNIHQRIAQITKEIGTLGMSGRNEEHKYNYLTEKDILDAAQPLEYRYGVQIIPSVIEHRNEPHHATQHGTPIHTTLIHCEMTVLCVENPEDRVVIHWWGEAQDHSDKGTYQAYTGLTKTFRAKLYAVATEDDPEVDKRFGSGGGKGGGGNGAWRDKPASEKQSKFAGNLASSSKLTDKQAQFAADLIAKKGVTGGEISELIDKMKESIEAYDDDAAAEAEGQGSMFPGDEDHDPGGDYDE